MTSLEGRGHSLSFNLIAWAWGSFTPHLLGFRGRRDGPWGPGRVHALSAQLPRPLCSQVCDGCPGSARGSIGTAAPPLPEVGHPGSRGRVAVSSRSVCHFY